MSQYISIKELPVLTIIGLYPNERTKAQKLIFNIEIELNEEMVDMESDKIQDTIDYMDIINGIMELAEKSSFLLIEKLCSEVISFIKADPKVNTVSLEVIKPQATELTSSVSIKICK